ncbi:hypothetical protein C8Q79DRAFT_902727 [Trametes meyenii]|nr:hypothetical protein C8Q79DRAFT_902727 [Trametes meyenii]
MPRLFPSLGRSSKDQGRGVYDQYSSGGYDAPQGYYGDYGYAEQEPRHNRSAWSKVLSRKSAKRRYARDDPSMMHPHDGGYRTTVEDYSDDPLALPGTRPVMPTDDTSSFEDLLSGRHSDTIPLVQRESSLTRLQQAFANDAFAPTMSAAPSGSHGAPFYAPQPVPAGQPHLTAVNDMHGPAMLVDPVMGGAGSRRHQGVRADIVQHAASYPRSQDRSHRRHRERERDRSAPARTAYREHPAYWDEPLDPNEDPPVVVVVEHGKNGKKDKYYIIPGGAPVIFEDENGNELTRVGDFSGRYRPPKRPRPVIVQDQYGQEICRAGFSNDDHISVGSRSNDNRSHHTSGSSRSEQRGRSTHRTREPREHTSHEHGHSSSRAYAPDSYHNDPHYQPSARPRAGTRPERDGPEVYYVDPRKERSTRSGRSGGSSDTLVRSSPRDHHSSSGRSYDRPRDYGPDDREYYRRDHHSRRQ